ncbi:MAG: alpha/beta hydrolase [Nitriliruptorales bacterium]|nr:alpha/beta hydrolase [Nitriliruptorales bacterium]
MLLIHGIPGSAKTWTPVAEGLAAAGFEVLVPDLLGFGASDRPGDVDGLHIDAQAAALSELLAATRDRPVIVVGHDYGVPIAVTIAHRMPRSVSGLVLAAGNLFTDTPIPMPLNIIPAPVVGKLAARMLMSRPMLRAMLRLGVGQPPPWLNPAHYLGDSRQSQAIRMIFSASLRELPDRYREVEAALGELQAPSVVIWGGRDPFFGIEQARRAAAAIPDAELRIEPDAGHFLPAERPAAFIDAVRQIQGRVQATAHEPAARPDLHPNSAGDR